MSSLLILGNGFDMHCGLKSSFKNYMGDELDIRNEFEKNHLESIKSLKEKIKYIKDTISEAKWNSPVLKSKTDEILHKLPSKNDGTFIESLLIMNNINELNGWADVENTIKTFLDGSLKDSSDLVNLKGLEKYESFMHFKPQNDKLCTISEAKDLVTSSFLYNEATGKVQKLDLEYSFILMMAVSFGFIFSYKNFHSEFLKFFKSDLTRFEKRFSKYIRREENEKRFSNTIIEDEDDYKYTSADLIQDLTELEDNNISILDFNYTHPNLSQLNVSFNRKVTMRHIHGSVKIEDKEMRPDRYFTIDSDDYKAKYDNDNIIIGIDETNLNDSDLYMFTKTYRVMESIEPNEPFYLNVLNKEIKNVIFYGHSLSQADYSYFQAVFDYLNIYESDVSLIFAYSVRKDQSSERKKESQCKSIFELINQYGETLDNRAKGHNLLHKMLLENRIQLKEID